MINMLIAMMAKTFDRIHGETATNFNFLRARVVSTWVSQHPSPPPFNLFALLYHILNGFVKTMRWVARKAQGKNTGSRKDSLLDSEAQRLAYSGQTSRIGCISKIISSPSTKPGVELSEPSKSFLANKKRQLTKQLVQGRATNEPTTEDAPNQEEDVSIAESSSIARRRARLQGTGESFFARVDTKVDTSSRDSACNFLLKSDFRDTQHLRSLAKLIAADIREKVGGKRKAETEILARIDRLELTLASVSGKTNEIFEYMHECALGSKEPAPGLRKPDSTDDDNDDLSGGGVSPLEGVAACLAPARPTTRPSLQPADACLSSNAPTSSDARGGQEHALWEEPVAASAVVHKIGAGKERRRVRRSRHASLSTAETLGSTQVNESSSTRRSRPTLASIGEPPAASPVRDPAESSAANAPTAAQNI